jgi:hypothetical protein
MSTTGPFSTGYIGAHRWAVFGPPGAYDWACGCGEHGRVAGNLAFLYECFGRHAQEKLQQAAVSLLLAPLPHTKQMALSLLRQSHRAKEAGEGDKQNILALAAVTITQERHQTREASFQALEWANPWPDCGRPGLTSSDYQDGENRFWLEVEPSGKTWDWATWRTDYDGDNEAQIGGGSSPTLAEAQRAAWDALMTYQEEQEDQEPF